MILNLSSKFLFKKNPNFRGIYALAMLNIISDNLKIGAYNLQFKSNYKINSEDGLKIGQPRFDLL